MRVLCLFLSLVLCAATLPPAAAEPAAILALQGFDPVTVIEGAPRQGSEQFASVHGRFRYLFVTAESKAVFDGDPDRWAFQNDGRCAMMPSVVTDGTIYAVYQGKLFAFGSEACLEDAKRDLADKQRMENVAILVFDGVQIIDYTGPYEVFGQAGYRVFTVAAGPGPVTTNMEMQVTPAYTLDNAPEAKVLVIPGGGVDAAMNNPRILSWIRERAATAEHVLTVCNGAFILARTGLLDGLTATTFYDLIPDLREAAPKTRIVADQRFVDNGKIITTAGLSSGIDGSLHVVERLRGKGRAQQVALNMEYDWRPDTPYARASLADAELRRLFGRQLRLEVPDGDHKLLSTQGTAHGWEVRWQVTSPAPRADLEAALARHLKEQGGWTASTAGDAKPSGEWRYTGEDRQPWTAQVDLRPLEEKAGEYSLAIRLERDSGQSGRK